MAVARAKDFTAPAGQGVPHSDDAPARDVILVLGMHRSGTSAIAGLLAKLGATPPNDLMPSHASNERGHWESLGLMEFNDQLLASAGSRWDDWRGIDPTWYESAEVEAFRRTAKERFEATFGAASLTVLKDPRVCRFVPFWLDVLAELGARPHVVIPVRSPLEVAQSLHERNGFSLSKGLLLWLRHVLDAEMRTRGVPRSIVMWDDVLASWPDAVEKIARETGLALPSQADRSNSEIDAFLSTDLKHQRVADATLVRHPDVHKWVLDVYQALSQLAQDPRAGAARTVLDRAGKVFDTACHMFGQAFAVLEMRIEEVQRQAVALAGERDQSRLRFEETGAALDAARLEKDQASAASEDRLAALMAEAAATSERHGRELEELRDLAANVRQERDHLIARSEEASADFGRMVSERAESMAALEDRLAVMTGVMSAEGERHRRELGELRGVADGVQQERDRLLAGSGAMSAALDMALAEKAEAMAALEDRLASQAADAIAVGIKRDSEIAQLREHMEGQRQERDNLLAKGQEAGAALEAARLDKDRLTATLKETTAEAARILAQGQERIVSLEGSEAMLHERAARAEARAAELDTELANARDGATSFMADISRLRQEIEQDRSENAGVVAELRSEMAQARGESQRSRMELSAVRDQLRHALRAREAMLGSTSWRVTAPLRAAVTALPPPLRMKLLSLARATIRMMLFWKRR